MTTILEQLKKPFPESDVKWRIGRSGEKNGKTWATCLAYLTSRAIQERLDEVFGIGGWENEFKPASEGGILCGISVKINNEWVTKWDGAENTTFEAVKGGLSSSMKRAAVMFGIGRYLYSLDEGFAEVTDKGLHYQPENKKKGLKAFKWNPPGLPKWALPEGTKHSVTVEKAPRGEIEKLIDCIKNIISEEELTETVEKLKNRTWTDEEKSRITITIKNQKEKILVYKTNLIKRSYKNENNK